MTHSKYIQEVRSEKEVSSIFKSLNEDLKVTLMPTEGAVMMDLPHTSQVKNEILVQVNETPMHRGEGDKEAKSEMDLNSLSDDQSHIELSEES